MMYREIIAVCSEIHTKHINTAVWADRRIFRCINKVANLLLLPWRYNCDRVSALSAISFHLGRSWSCSAHSISFSFFKSFLTSHSWHHIPDITFLTSHSHRDLDHPAGLPLNGFHLCILFNYASFGHSIYVSKPTQSLGFNIIYYVPVFY